MFTLGCPDLLVTVDHQPLISILGEKGLADIPNPRLYRFKERCMRFRFTIQCLPGGKNDMPDCMSRVYDQEEDEYIDPNNYSNLEADTEIGATISACYIAGGPPPLHHLSLKLIQMAPTSRQTREMN